MLVKHFDSSEAVRSVEQLLSCSVTYSSLQKSGSILSIGNAEESIIRPLTLGNQGKGWEDQMLKKLYFFKTMFDLIPSVGSSGRSCCCLSCLLSVSVQMLCEEVRGGCGSRDKNFKPNTKDW